MRLELTPEGQKYISKQLFNFDNRDGKLVKSLEVYRVIEKSLFVLCIHKHSIIAVPKRHFVKWAKETSR